MPDGPGVARRRHGVQVADPSINNDPVTFATTRRCRWFSSIA